jgi:hypothetical protein
MSGAEAGRNGRPAPALRDRTMTTGRKIYLAAASALVLGGAVYLSETGPAPVAPPTPTSAAVALPAIALPRAAAAGVTKIELTSPDDDDKSRLQRIAIERLGAQWELTSPLRTAASTSEVEELLANLETLHVWKLVDPGTAFYDTYDLTESKALHVVAWAGARPLVDLFCGKSSQDGQLARLPGRDGIWSLVNWGSEGYQGFLYTRDLRSWRETSIFNFHEEDVVAIEISNRTDVLRFSRDPAGSPDAWRGTRAKRSGNGKPAGPESAWTSFDVDRVNQLLREYHALAADDFAAGVSPAGAGLDRAQTTGGVVDLQLRSGTHLTLRVGKLSTNRTRWAIKNSRWALKDGGDGTIYALSPFTAAWALADSRRFEPPAPARRPR